MPKRAKANLGNRNAKKAKQEKQEKAKGEDEDIRDSFTRFEHKHMTQQYESNWKESARKDTMLPVVTKEGKVLQPEISAPALVPKPAVDVFGSKKDVSEHPYAACAKFLSDAQRNALSAVDARLERQSLLRFIEYVEEIGRLVVIDPVTELFKLESVFTRMNYYRELYTSATDLSGLEDIAKSYLVLFVAIGKIFKHVIPGYIVVTSESAVDKESKNAAHDVPLLTETEKQKEQTHRKASRRFDLLALHLYKKWLRDNLQTLICADQYILSYAELTNPVCELLSDMLHTVKSFNLKEEFFSCYILLLAKTGHDQLFNNLALAIEQDLTLSLSALVVPMILARSDSIVGRTMRLLDHLCIDRKEKNALAELARRGITPKQVLAKRKSEVEISKNRELALGLVAGDYQKFVANKTEVLESILKLFIAVVRQPQQYHVECVYESLRSLSRHASLVNLEMVNELFDELKKLSEDVLRCRKFSNTSASLVLAAVMAAIELVKISSKSSDLYIESDLQWIIPAVMSAVSILMYSPQATGWRRASPDEGNANSLSLEDLIEILEQVIDSRRSLGSLGDSFSHLAKCPKATELYVCLSAATVLCANQTSVTKLNELRETLVKRYPTIQGTHDDEGVIVDTISPPLTVSWCKHLARISVFGAK